MWLSGNHRLMIGSIIVITGIAAILLATTKSSPDSVATPGGFGTVKEAFDTASGIVRRHLTENEFVTVVIDPEFRSTMFSKSKIWIVKGRARCLDNDKVYEWTVILNYQEMQEWELLVKTITLIPDD